VDRRRNLIQWVRNSVNNRCAQRGRVFRVQLLGPVSLQAVLGTALEGILLATSIDADDGPHAMIVGFELHPGSPAQVEDSQIVYPVNRLDAGTLRLSESPHYLRGFAYSCGYQIPDRSMRVLLLERSTAFFNETFFLKHRDSSFPPRA
jgi:hypothetical protein